MVPLIMGRKSHPLNKSKTTIQHREVVGGGEGEGKIKIEEKNGPADP